MKTGNLLQSCLLHGQDSLAVAHIDRGWIYVPISNGGGSDHSGLGDLLGIVLFVGQWADRQCHATT